ncbi:MAG: CPBP family intramembrane metalloprotease [Deltaproteobacteria bacterium]|nr:CPBP family intramembrane metalloprotease [Deltaproteobacteria bacterium]
MALSNRWAERQASAVTHPASGLQVFGISFLLYIPMVFVLEEVFFRGALDTYARGPHLANDRTLAVFVSLLWGVWPLPLVVAVSGLTQLPIILGFHLILGLLLTFPWRRSGNLAVPASPTRSSTRSGMA